MKGPFSKKYFAVTGLIVVLLAAGGWFYARRPQRIEIASYVPGSALAYLEINDWPLLVEHLSSTQAWQRLAPDYGLSGQFDHLGKLGWLGWLGSLGWPERTAGLAAGSEVAVLARAQFAIVVTGIEVRGEEVKPRLALIAETQSSAQAVNALIEKRLPELAEKAFGRSIKETSEYSGVRITGYRPASGAEGSERRMLSAQIEGEWILANQSDALQACIDTRLGRAPAMASNFYLQNARPVVAHSGEFFGFITGDGVTRLLRMGTHLMSGGVVTKAVLAGAVGDVLTDLSTRVSDGLAFGTGFENGMVVDRYALLFKPDLVDRLKQAIKVSQSEPSAPAMVPSSAREFTLIRVENPNRTLDKIEASVSARIGAGQSFLLHQFLIGAREAFLGVKSGESLEAAIGDELLSFSLSTEFEDRVWLIAARDRAALGRIVENYLRHNGSTATRQNYRGVEILSSSDPQKNSAVFLENFLALGGRKQLNHLVDAHRRNEKIITSDQYTAAGKPLQQSPIVSYSSVSDESAGMMATIARWAGSPSNSNPAGAGWLPYAVSATSLNSQGIYLESRSPFGNFPFFISLVSGATNGQ